MAFKIAVIGLGKIAHDQHLPCIAKNSNFELAAVVSSREPYKNVPSFKTATELFASGIRLDAVSLCMPPAPRYQISREAFEAGVHVLIEKPPTPTMGEFDAMVQLARKAKRIVFTTWHSQYNAAVDEAKRLLAGKTVNKLKVIWKEDVRHWHPGQEWIWEPGGFGVLDPAINAFSIVTKIMPQPVFVESASLQIPANKATPIAGQIQFKSSTGVAGDFSADLDWRQRGTQTWDIDVGTSDGLELKLRKGGTELAVDGKPAVAAPSEEYEAIYGHFAELLKEGRSHIDGGPLQLVSDCFMRARCVATEAFV